MGGETSAVEKVSVPCNGARTTIDKAGHAALSLQVEWSSAHGGKKERARQRLATEEQSASSRPPSRAARGLQFRVDAATGHVLPVGRPWPLLLDLASPLSSILHSEALLTLFAGYTQAITSA